MNSHLIEISYRGPSDRRGSRVVLSSHRFPADRISDGYDSGASANVGDQGEAILRQLGYTVVTQGETKKGYFCAVAEFLPLRDALADFKAPANYRRTWIVTFTGREAGAIGMCVPHTVTVEAHDLSAARLKVYATHERITDARFHRRDEVAWAPRVPSRIRFITTRKGRRA